MHMKRCSTVAILITISVVVVVAITIVLSQSTENPEVGGKLGLRIFCSITCTRGQRPEEGPVTACADGQFTGGAHLVTLTWS